MKNESSVYEFSVRNLDGTPVSLDIFKGEALLIVNTATACGFTPQLGGLQKLYENFNEYGFEILAFPCNQFASQEPLRGEEIKAFCRQNYNAGFKVFDLVNVNGRKADPLFSFLKTSLPAFPFSIIKWNFTKFLINRSGIPVKRFEPWIKPEKMETQIRKILSEPIVAVL